MIVSSTSLSLVFQGFRKVVNASFEATNPDWPKIAMAVPSQSASENDGWLGQFPSLREWLGPRVVTNLSADGFALQNKTFEATVAVARTDIEDDKIGIFKPVFAEMGGNAKRHP